MADLGTGIKAKPFGVEQMSQDIIRDEGMLSERQSQLFDRQAKIGEEREKTLAPMEQAITQKLGEPMPERQKVDVPQFQPKPIVDAKEYENLSYGLIAMAMIGGVASKGKWLEVGEVLNGALDGYLKGNVQVAQKRYRDYDEMFKGAIAKENQANKEFEDILKNRELRIRDQINQYRITAAKYDRQDALAAAQSRSLDAMWRSLESRKSAVGRLEEMHDRTAMMLSLQGGGESKLTPEGEKYLVKLQQTNQAIPRTRRGLRDDDTINRLGAADAKAVAAGETDIPASRAEFKANQAALTQLTKDLSAIKPFKEMLDVNAEIALDLGKKVVSTDSRLANKSLNWLKQNVGDNPDTAEYLAQMAFVQTEAARVLQNPRLVGQLTDTARHEMQSVVSGDMPLKATERVIRRIQQDGKNRIAAMERQADSLKQKMGSSGASAPLKEKSPSLTNSKGWALHEDAQGNKAYVGPNGEIEEVH